MIASLLLLFLGPAHAQDAPPVEPSPVARCADAARGAEVEICLQLAVENPDQVDGIAAALRAHIAREGSPDQQLMLALLALIDDATAPDAAAQVAALGDRRGVPALVACAERRPAEVSGACIRAVARFEEGLAHLEGWLADDRRPTGLRIDAAAALGLVQSDAAADVLVDTLRRPGLPAALRQALLDTLDRAYPQRTDATDGQVATDGRVWLSLGGGYAMGFAMGAAGHFGQTDLAALGLVTGAVGGGTGGWLYGRAWPMEAGDAAYLTTSTVLGSAGGLLLGDGASPGNDDWVYGGGLLGLAGGAAVGVATRRLHAGSGLDAGEAVGVSAMAGLALGSGALVLQRSDPTRDGSGPTGPRIPSLAAGIGVLGGAAAGHLTAPSVDLEARDWGTIALATGFGAAATALVPLSDPADRAPLVGLGVGVGSLVGYGLAAPLDLPADIQGAAWAGGLYGGVFGAGAGMLYDPESAAPAYGALVGATAGMIGAGGLARLDPEPLDDRDIVLVGLTTAWVGGQAAGWATVAQPANPRQNGWFLVVPAAVAGGVAAATPVVDIPVPQSMAATSVGLWGAYVGGVSAELTQNRDRSLGWSLVGANIGLGTGALAMSPVVGASPVVLAVADAGGVVGGSVVALGAAFATDQPDRILAASLVGSGVGFTTGAIIGASWKKGGTRDMARMPVRTRPVRLLVRPDMGPDRMGLALEVQEW